VEGDRHRLDSHTSYGQPLFAPVDGRVDRAVTDRPDVAIGESDSVQILGNHVVIEVGGGRWVLLAHLMKGSVLVSEGQQVRRGQPIARCGNSGNTSAPHLHLQVQNGPDFEASDLVSLPIIFRDAVLVRRGRHRGGTIGDVRRNDRLISLSP
jgi:murein DD-endopeptidase MepM/ murein hydrolase activator NlpD